VHITDDPDREEGWVAYAFVQDVAASWEQYGRVAAALVEPAPAGLLLHVAGPARPEPTFRDVQARHLVFGEAITAHVCRQTERARWDIRRRSTPRREHR
jgi:hypothetical protein